MPSVIPAQQDILLMTICSLLFPGLSSSKVHIGVCLIVVTCQPLNKILFSELV